MRLRNIQSLVLILIICFGTLGLANKKDAMRTERFRKLDVNHDGKLSLIELRSPTAKISAKQEKTLAMEFDSKDMNYDGHLSLAEFKTMKR